MPPRSTGFHHSTHHPPLPITPSGPTYFRCIFRYASLFWPSTLYCNFKDDSCQKVSISVLGSGFCSAGFHTKDLWFEPGRCRYYLKIFQNALLHPPPPTFKKVYYIAHKKSIFFNLIIRLNASAPFPPLHLPKSASGYATDKVRTIIVQLGRGSTETILRMRVFTVPHEWYTDSHPLFPTFP